MSLLVFDSSFCCLSPFHLHLCGCFKAMSLVRIFPLTGLSSVVICTSWKKGSESGHFVPFRLMHS